MPGTELSYYLDTYNTWSSYEAETHGVFVAYAAEGTATPMMPLKATSPNRV